MLQFEICDDSDEQFQAIRSIFSNIDGAEVRKTGIDTYSLSGAEAAEFIVVAVASGAVGNAAYDILKSATKLALAKVGELASSRGTKIDVKIRGVAHRIGSEADAMAAHHDLHDSLPAPVAEEPEEANEALEKKQ